MLLEMILKKGWRMKIETRGRKPAYQTPCVPCNVTLDRHSRVYYTAIGDGNLSRGIRKVAHLLSPKTFKETENEPRL